MLAAALTLILGVAAVFSAQDVCKSGQYTTGGECCKQCQPGEGMVKPCGQTQTECEPCLDRVSQPPLGGQWALFERAKCKAERVRGETVSVWDRSVSAGVFHVWRPELAELKESENAERENKLDPDLD
ncbi:hypothetical protein MHYP_G00159230 [Metynnis hypsauchen]